MTYRENEGVREEIDRYLKKNASSTGQSRNELDKGGEDLRLMQLGSLTFSKLKSWIPNLRTYAMPRPTEQRPRLSGQRLAAFNNLTNQERRILVVGDLHEPLSSRVLMIIALIPIRDGTARM
jgi:type II secretory pathway component PulM